MASLRSPEGRKRAVFRADASAALGGGHVLRSLVLADQLAARGWACAFATRRESLATVSALRTAGHEIVAVDDDSPAALAQRIADGCDVLVVDHYGLDADFERASRAWAHRIVVIDDLADRAHDADLLIDPTLGRSAGDYRKLVPPACQLLLGPAFALLRPEFARSRPASLARDRGRLAQVFMCFGATDPGNHIGRLLPAVATAFPETVFDAVVGASAPHLRDVEAVARQFANVRLHVGARDVAGLLANADFAIGNAGTGAWERCALGVPGVALAVADNQKEIARTLTAAGASSRADASGSALVEVLRHATQESRATVGRAAANVCDGLGAMRVVGAIDPVVARDGKPVWLAPMTAADSDLVLAWQCAPGVRRFSRNSTPPSAEDHARWFTAKLADPNCIFNMIHHDGRPAGVLRFDRLAPDRDAFEVSILVAPELQGRNIAGAALAQGRRLVPWAEFHAEVLPGNAASAALFARSGYSRNVLGRFVARPQGDAA